MAIILSIETATTVGSVALHQEGKLLAQAHLHLSQSHATALLPMIEHLLQITQLSYTQIEAIALSQGPGSYTGLRIGASTAKGICFAQDKPLIAASTLAAMAKKVINQLPNAQNYLYCPMIDARRMEVFCALYNHQLQEIQPIQPLVVTNDSFQDILTTQKILFFGDGSAKCNNTIVAQNAIFLENIFPDAACIGELAWQKWQLQQTEDIAYFEPFYLKEFYNTAKK